MEYFQLILYLIAAIVPSVFFIYGRVSFRKKKALFLKMIAGGIGCISLNRWFYFVYFLTQGSHPTGFHIGMLGMLGAYAFFLFANYGQIDSLVDDGTAVFRKYRIIAIAAPALVWALYAVIFIGIKSTEMRICFGVICLMISFCDYYHLKHLIIPDVNSGIVKSLRPFNLMAMIYSILYLGMLILGSLGRGIWYYVVIITMVIVSGLIIPFTVRGVKKWTI